MEVSRMRALRGPNLWTRHTAVEAMVCCGGGATEGDGAARFNL